MSLRIFVILISKRDQMRETESVDDCAAYLKEEAFRTAWFKHSLVMMGRCYSHGGMKWDD